MPSADPPLRILYLEADQASADPALETLRRAGLELHCDVVVQRAEFETRLRQSYDLVLAGYGLSGWTGMDALALLRKSGSDLPFILVTGSLDTDAAVACVRQGASDYVLKSHLGRLPQAVTRALTERALRHEHRLARRALAESERRFRSLVLATTDLIWIADKSGQVTGRLARWQQVTGQTQEQLAGMGWLEAVHPDDRGALRNALERGSAAGTPIECEVRIHNSGGDFRRYAFKAVPVKSSEGALLEWIGSANDVTDHATAEQALKESELRYRALIEATFDAVVITDRGTVVEANPGFGELFAAPRDALLNTRLEDLVEPESRAEFASRLSSGQPQRFSFFAHARDGRRLELEAVTRGAIRAGHTIQLTALRDHTAHRELERQFLHAQRLEAVGQLAGGIAHDFNNILTSVLGFSQFLLDQLPPDSPYRSDAEEIYRAGELAAVLTRKLLAFSRRQPAHPQVIDLNEATEAACGMLGRLLGEDIRVELELQARPALVKADSGQLEQVVLNLAVNARDAMPHGGRLGVRTRTADLSAGLLHSGGVIPRGRYVVLSVKDEGIGMSPEIQSHIFEPFFTTKGGNKGTGLGLSTVYGIVQQSGGHIVVQSAPGQGTSFDLYFPATQSGASRPQVLRPLGATPGDEHILLVEDQDSIRTLTERVLKRAGYTVLSAESGAAARDVARRTERIHLIVMDVLLPGERGPRVAEELLALHPAAKLVYVSGTSSSSDESGLPAMQWFLQKPFTTEQLLSTVRSALDAPTESVAPRGRKA